MKNFGKAAVAVLACFTLGSALAQSGSSNNKRDDERISDSRDLNVNERRADILEMQKKALSDLRKDADARKLLDSAYGQAVFDTTKGGFIVTGAGGTGVATHKNGSNPVYMHMGEGGVSLGAGIENYRLILIFEDKDTYDKFVQGAWNAGVSAQAAAGGEGKSAVGKFVNGVAVYHLSDKGVIAQVDATGVKFWPSDKLNPGPA